MGEPKNAYLFNIQIVRPVLMVEKKVCILLEQLWTVVLGNMKTISVIRIV